MADRTHSEGWVTFAAILSAVAGAANLMFGLAAMFGWGKFGSQALIFASMYAFGLTLACWGAAQLITSWFLVRRSALGRIAGIIIAAVSLFMWTMWIGAYTHAALLALVLDVLVIFGLSVTKEYFES